MVWLLVALWLVVGVATAVVAERRGHDRGLWLALGLVFPVAALVALLLGYPKTQPAAGKVAPDVREALHHSRVARALAREPGLDGEGIVAATGLDEDRVDKELRTLRVLGLVRKSRDHHWTLSPRAAAALTEDTPSPD